MDNIKVIDALGNEATIDENSFKLVQSDKKIFDQKFDTKPTTFAKDAFKRFCKNKSSIAGAVIIGMIILGCVAIPVLNPHNITTTRVEFGFLPPKLFESGTGWWDGTQVITKPVNQLTNKVTTYNESGITKVLEEYTEENDGVFAYATGGIFVLYNDTDLTTDANPLNFTNYMKNSKYFDITAADNDKLSFKVTDDISTKMKSNGFALAPYKVTLEYFNTNTYESDEKVLVDWNSEVKEYNFNLSSVLSDSGLTKSYKSYIRFDIQPVLNKKGYVGLEYLKLETSSTDTNKISLYDKVSIIDANVSACAGTTVKVNDLDGDKDKLWQKDGYITISRGIVKYRKFIYDAYEVAYGKVEKQVGETLMNEYVNKGYCEYNPEIGISSFKVLSDECPIISVKTQKYVENKLLGENYYEYTCIVINWKYLGMSGPEKFIFGTDRDGFDIVKLCFKGLGISLLMAVAIFAINFTIGTVYGSIEGYYGGSVDLIMERICEILGGMPFIALITLLSLKFGRTVSVFILAETLTGWIGNASLARTQFYRFRGREYVLASRTLGASDSRLIYKHILPNGLGTIITSSVLSIPGIILGEATISYLGLGIQSTKTFGLILDANKDNLNLYPHLVLFPAFLVSLLMISFNLFGNGLRDAVNPSLKGGE